MGHPPPDGMHGNPCRCRFFHLRLWNADHFRKSHGKPLYTGNFCSSRFRRCSRNHSGYQYSRHTVKSACHGQLFLFALAASFLIYRFPPGIKAKTYNYSFGIALNFILMHSPCFFNILPMKINCKVWSSGVLGACQNPPGRKQSFLPLYFFSPFLSSPSLMETHGSYTEWPESTEPGSRCLPAALPCHHTCLTAHSNSSLLRGNHRILGLVAPILQEDSLGKTSVSCFLFPLSLAPLFFLWPPCFQNPYFRSTSPGWTHYFFYRNPLLYYPHLQPRKKKPMITTKNLSFAYPGKSPVFRNLSLTFKMNST